MGRARPKVPQIAIASVCLFGAAGLMWAVLPMSEAGGYGEPPGADGLDAVGKAVPVQGTMTVRMAGDGGSVDGAGDGAMVERLARDMAGNWLNGTITDEEFFGAMSYLYGQGHLEVVGKDGLGVYGAAAGMVDGPTGSAQGWCKEGLVRRTNAFTGDMVCVPDGYAEGAGGSRWIAPVEGHGGVGGGDGGGLDGVYDGTGGYGAWSPEEVTWQWRPLQDGKSYSGGGQSGAYASDLKEQIADLENVNDGLMRTIAKLQEALMEVHLQGGAVGGGNVGDAADRGGQGATAKHTMTVNLAGAASVASAAAGNGICLHGTDATFTSVIDPAMLSETGGSLGSIPMPDGRYTVLLMAASSTPVSVGLQLDGDAGLTYGRTFALDDTGRPPGEEATMWDYNSGVAEIVVGEAQLVNATAVVEGGDGMAVFAALARCR